VTDTPARTTPLAVVMDDSMKAWYRQAAKDAGMPTASLIRRVLARYQSNTTGRDRATARIIRDHVILRTPDPILERRDAQLRKGDAR
jgi:hypothetical protein